MSFCNQRKVDSGLRNLELQRIKGQSRDYTAIESKCRYKHLTLSEYICFYTIRKIEKSKYSHKKLCFLR